MTISQEKPDTSGQNIPARIVVGVTGHRNLSNESTLADQVNSVFNQIKQKIPSLLNTPVLFTILSPLAEGADRLVAREGLNRSGSQLEVVLPLAKDEYMRDFTSSKSKAEFEELLQGRRVKQLRAPDSRNGAYAQAGRYVVDHCDVLIALWDGKAAAGPGGTGDIVQYARLKLCPLFWINTQGLAEITYEPGNGLEIEALHDLDRYNSERIDAGKIGSEINRHRNKLTAQAQQSGCYSDKLSAIYEKLLPHYARASLLSKKYQKRYYWAGILIYSLAAAAVGIAAFYLFESVVPPSISLLEVAFMLVVLIIIRRGRSAGWHEKYMDYRFLVERFRSALFMSLLSVDMQTPNWRRYGAAHSSRDWVIAAFSSVWSEMPLPTPPKLAEFDGLKNFLALAWVEGQINYHKQVSGKNERKHHLLTRIGDTLFLLTLIAALLHVIDKFEWIKHHSPVPVQHMLEFFGEHTPWLVLIAIVAPAVGGALGAIRAHREYLRSAKRSNDTAQQLENLRIPILESQSPESLFPLARQAEEIMLHENEDWRTVVRFHELELPA